MNLYLRLLWLLLTLPFLRRRDIFDSSALRFHVLPTDCDLNFHMNNGRYLTFMDLGRLHLLAQSKAVLPMLRGRWQPILAAAEISYVRALRPFQSFTLVTRLLTWDDKYFYLEQRFMHGATLCAVALVKGLFVARGKRVLPGDVFGVLGVAPSAPPMPEMVAHWKELAPLKKEHAERH
jgi:acyl-CoA thioesterase FadM